MLKSFLRAKTSSLGRRAVRVATYMIFGTMLIGILSSAQVIRRDALERNDGFTQNTSLVLQAYDNYDLRSGPITSSSKKRISKYCATTCRSDAICQAYSFDKWKKQCSLKKTAGCASLDPRRFFKSALRRARPVPTVGDVITECGLGPVEARVVLSLNDIAIARELHKRCQGRK